MRHFELEHDFLSRLAKLSETQRRDALWLLENINGLVERDVRSGYPTARAYHTTVEKARAALRDGTLPELTQIGDNSPKKEVPHGDS